MIKLAPTLLREIAKDPAGGEVPDFQNPSSVTTRGGITNFHDPKGRPVTDEERLTQLRVSIQKAARVWTPPGPIEAISIPPSDKF